MRKEFEEILKQNQAVFYNQLAYDKLVEFLLANAKEI